MIRLRNVEEAFLARCDKPYGLHTSASNRLRSAVSVGKCHDNVTGTLLSCSFLTQDRIQKFSSC